MTPYQIYQTLDHERFASWWDRTYPSKMLEQIAGIGKIRHDADRFEFDAGGKDAAILCIGDDLVAWYQAAPTVLYTLNGEAADANLIGLREAVIYKQAFHAHDGIVSWLVSGCIGGVPIRTDVWPYYKALPEITVSTAPMKARVEAELNKLAVVPRVKVVK